MKNLLVISMLGLGAMFAAGSASAAESVTNVQFSNNNYCGSYSSNMKNGKKFKLYLNANQELVILNDGNDQVNVAYVEGPSGRLVGNHSHYDNGPADYATSYRTQRRGEHYIKVYGNDSRSSIEICAY